MFITLIIIAEREEQRKRQNVARAVYRGYLGVEGFGDLYRVDPDTAGCPNFGMHSTFFFDLLAPLSPLGG